MQPPTASSHAVLAYRNDDGGFGHGLEPDKLAPESQPRDVQFALQTLHAAGAHEPEVARRTCDFLGTVADDRGLVPIVLPSVGRYPRAQHWGDGRFEPTLSPAIAIAGYLHALEVQHPWLERVTGSCLEGLERTPLYDALRSTTHSSSQSIPGGEALVPRLAEALPRARYFRRDPADKSYGLSPLKFPRDWFDDALHEAHLDALEREQQEDGGWPIAWQPPGEAAVLAWRAIWTIEALRTMRENDRLGARSTPS